MVLLRRRAQRRDRGQTLAEFALVFPLFIFLLLGVIEFAFFMNAVLAANFASRDASLVAAEAGQEGDADCLILQQVEDSISAPADHSLVQTVTIYQADRSGRKTGTQIVYRRGGDMVCFRPNGAALHVPYTYDSGGYSAAVRCNLLAGCGGTHYIDQIGVEITYAYRWHTPVGQVFNGLDTTTVTKGNVMRMEPIL